MRTTTGARSFRRAVAVCVAFAVVASLPFLAGAQLGGAPDPDDVSGLMDIKNVEVSGTSKSRFLIATFPKWRAKRVWDRGYGLVHIDARGDEWFEFYALIYSDGSQMKGRLYRDRRQKHDYAVGKLSAWKPNRKSVIVKIPVHKLDMPATRTHLRWFAKTLMIGGHCKTVCIDRAPDAGSLEHVVVDALPTPTPSPTVTPTPTPSASPTSGP